MRKLGVLLVMAFFVLSVSGLSLAQTPSTTATEKASDNAAFKRGDSKSTPQPNADKVKAEKEKAAKEKAAKEKAAKEKASKEKAKQEKAGKAKVKTEKEKTKPKMEEVKNQ